MAALAAAFVKMFIERTAQRLGRLEEEATLREGLKSLEDVATLGDLERQWSRTEQLVMGPEKTEPEER